MSLQKILIAVDDSPIAAHAADVGIELAKALHSTLGFVHVFDARVAPGTAWGITAERVGELSEEQAKRLLELFRERAGMQSDVPAFLKSADPASDIIEVAKKWSADMIVMGSHGRGRLGGLVLGSVSQAVLHHAPCPVLVVRPRT